MMLYKNMKVKVRSPNGDTDFFDIVAGVLQWDTLATYMFIGYVFRLSIDLMKENGFTHKKRQEADDTPQKLLQTQTTQMTRHFLQIYLPKPNLCCIVLSRQ